VKTALEVVGWVLLISQGVIPLVQKLAGNGLGAFQLARWLPGDLQVPASVAAIAVAALLLLLARSSAGSTTGR
jgi:hypothetical protein